MSVGIAEIEAAAAAPVVELTVIETPRRAAEGDLGFLDSVKDRVEFALADMKGEMVAFKFAVVVEQQVRVLLIRTGAK
jgi:hypothetical protein